MQCRHPSHPKDRSDRMSENFNTNTPNLQKNSCSNCGWEIRAGSTFEQVLSGNFDNPLGGDWTATRITPMRAGQLEADVLVPALQSLIWSVATALPACCVAMAFRWRWEAPAVVAATSVLVSWIASMKRVSLAASKVEEFSYIARDELTGTKSDVHPDQTIRLEVFDRGDGKTAALKIVDLPAGVEPLQFREFCQDVLAGKSMARENWAGSGKVFSRGKYDQLIKALRESGIVRSTKGVGTHLTVGGKHAIRRMIREWSLG